MDGKSCFFLGHREASDELLPALDAVVARHITEYGVKTFIVGGYGGFDRLASRVLKEAKGKHPEITLLRLIPYHPAEHPVKTPEGFDGTYYPLGLEKVPRKFAIVRTNRLVLEQSDFLITYVKHSASNAYNLLAYARKRQQRGLIKVCNLDDIEK